MQIQKRTENSTDHNGNVTDDPRNFLFRVRGVVGNLTIFLFILISLLYGSLKFVLVSIIISQIQDNTADPKLERVGFITV